jgi:hypothetical protein
MMNAGHGVNNLNLCVCRRLLVEHPILTFKDMHTLKASTHPKWTATIVDISFPAYSGVQGLEKALDRICEDATTAVR